MSDPARTEHGASVKFAGAIIEVHPFCMCGEGGVQFDHVARVADAVMISCRCLACGREFAMHILCAAGGTWECDNCGGVWPAMEMDYPPRCPECGHRLKHVPAEPGEKQQ